MKEHSDLRDRYTGRRSDGDARAVPVGGAEDARCSILRQMERMGMPEAATKGKLRVLDMCELRKEMVEHEGNWREPIMGYVQESEEATRLQGLRPGFP
ncbi:MAG: hypothetical protein MZV70_43765 [Desulfobacterales bacterium]|nr:hypothetical protein [Desulfobacterales bacterium]